MIVGISGEAGAGKSTVAGLLIERGFKRAKFANALKEMFRSYLRYRGVDEDRIERMVEGDLKESPVDELGGKTPRHFMQSLGQWGRDGMYEDFWVDTEFHVQGYGPMMLFDDLRHSNEEDAIRARGGLFIQVVGRGGINSDHLSEQFKPQRVDVVLDNSGTIEELAHKVDVLAKDLSWIQ